MTQCSFIIKDDRLTVYEQSTPLKDDTITVHLSLTITGSQHMDTQMPFKDDIY